MLKTKITSLTVLALAAAFAAPAQAQYVIQYSDGQGYGYRAEPLYPYVAQPSGRAYPYVSARPAPAVRPVAKTDPAVIDELRKRRKPKTVAVKQDNDETLVKKKITKTIVVREKPVVQKTYRVVEHPPVVVQREISEDQLPANVEPRPTHAEDVPHTGRVIRAEAEVTILGPDRMSIRLYRKHDGVDANAKSDKPMPKRKRDAKAETPTKLR